MRLACSVVIASLIGSAVCANDMPVVGILASEVIQDIKNDFPEASSYIVASYVKWLEQAGARVTYILPTWSDDEVVHKFGDVDAVLITDTTGNTSKRYNDVVRSLIRLTFHFNNRIPGSRALWAIGSGFDALITFTATSGDSVFHPTADFTNGASLATTLSSNCTQPGQTCHLLDRATPRHILDAFGDGHSPAAFYATPRSVYVARLLEDPALSAQFNVVLVSGLAGDRRGSIVAAIEAKAAPTVPVYGSVFHPEIPAFEVGEHASFAKANHREASIIANNYMAFRFLSSIRAMSDPAKVPSHWIAARAPAYVGKRVPYQQAYLFTASD